MNKTEQRRAILEELRLSNNHPTADKLYESLRHKLPQISLGTVYRNLEQMSQMGKIKKLSLAGHQKRFDGDMSQHYHVRCPNCDCVTNIVVDSLSDLDDNFKNVAENIGCESYYFELTKLCNNCKKILEEKEALEKELLKKQKREVLTWNK